MAEKSKVENNKSDFHSSIPDYSNEEILAILKKRKQYQKEAADLALHEAIKRGLIHSEQDLFSEEFKEMPETFSIFPIIENDNYKNKIRKSIARTFIITGVIPLVWGFLKINESQTLEGGLLLVLGIIWIFASSQLIRKGNLQMVNLLFVLFASSIIYIIKLFMAINKPAIMDVFIPVIICLLIFYGILFLRKLT